MGGCGWIRCTRNHVLSHIAQDRVCFWFGAVSGQSTPNRVLSHVAQDMVCFWFAAVSGQSAQILGLSGAVRGHNVELEGPRGPFSTGKSSCMCRVATISFHLAFSSRFQGSCGQKKADFDPKLQILKWRSGTCHTRSQPPPLSFWLILCVVVPHTHRQHPPKFRPNPKHHNGAVIFAHFCACLLLACQTC